ncbi:hypothetical protein C8R47DRAFT_1080963 [Mycena vitilis]|nr:hypothetical protein C8R47DRAFT_1080963 [Mycena vitilis]
MAPANAGVALKPTQKCGTERESQDEGGIRSRGMKYADPEMPLRQNKEVPGKYFLSGESYSGILNLEFGFWNAEHWENESTCKGKEEENRTRVLSELRGAECMGNTVSRIAASPKLRALQNFADLLWG